MDPARRAALEAALPGGPRFDAFFEGDLGERLRRLPDRENRRWEAGGTVYHLKIHFRGSRAAAGELEGALAFRRAGVPAALPAAWGEDAGRGSFWMAAAAPGEPLDALLARPGAVPPAARRGRLRRAGLFHRDLYLNHWIGRPAAAGGWDLALIDLQRWGRTGLRSERWFVKDAAAILHSARGTGLTRTDGVRFLRACFGIERLDRRAKRFARAVFLKAARMAAHVPKTPVR